MALLDISHRLRRGPIALALSQLLNDGLRGHRSLYEDLSEDLRILAMKISWHTLPRAKNNDKQWVRFHHL